MQTTHRLLKGRVFVHADCTIAILWKKVAVWKLQWFVCVFREVAVAVRPRRASRSRTARSSARSRTTRERRRWRRTWSREENWQIGARIKKIGKCQNIQFEKRAGADRCLFLIFRGADLWCGKVVFLVSASEGTKCTRILGPVKVSDRNTGQRLKSPLAWQHNTLDR